MVSIVILNYNGKKHLATFLPSVVHFSKPHRIIVADNASTDDSVEFLKQNFPEVEIIQNQNNYGFAGGYNQALQTINTKYILLLNSDVEVTSNWIKPLIDIMETNSECGACQPKILDYKDKIKFEYAGAGGGFIDWLGYPFCRGRILETCERDENQYDDIQEIFWATGACMLVRTEIFKYLGGFDSDFFAHMEEIDLCWRMKNNGNSIFYTGLSTVYHLGGGTLTKSNPRKTFLNYRNSLAMLFKNLPTKHILLNIFIRLLLDGISGIRLFLKGNFKDVIAIIKAHFSFYFMIPNLIKKEGKLFLLLGISILTALFGNIFSKKEKLFFH